MSLEGRIIVASSLSPHSLNLTTELGTEVTGKGDDSWSVKNLIAADCRFGFPEGQTAQYSAIRGLWRPTLHPPQSPTDGRTLESHFCHTPISTQPTDCFKWSGELKHTPTLSFSVANLFTIIFFLPPHLSLEVNLGFKLGSHWVRGSP